MQIPTATLNRFQSWVDIILLLATTLITISMIALLASDFVARAALPALLVIQGLAVLLVVYILLNFRRQRWRDIGLWAPRSLDAGRALQALLACFAVNFVFNLGLVLLDPELIRQHLAQLRDVAAQLGADTPFPLLALVIVFVGLYEEIAARGFLLSRCRTALSGQWTPILVSSVLFGLGHAYQGWIGIAQTSLIGMVLAYFTLRWGTVWPAIFAHAALDLASVSVIRTLSDQDLLGRALL